MLFNFTFTFKNKLNQVGIIKLIVIERILHVLNDLRTIDEMLKWALSCYIVINGR